MSAFPHVSEALQRSIGGIEPCTFNEHLRAVLADRPLTPAALTVTTGRAIDGAADLEALADRGVGVQLGYEGLRLTRGLIAGDSWLDRTDVAREDLDMLAAEILVARGFHHLSGTGVVTDAVETVRRFGQRHAQARGDADPVVDGSLEGDILMLAVDAGADCVLSAVPPPIASVGADLAERLGDAPMRPPEEALAGVAEEISRVHHLHEPPVVEEPSSSWTVDP